MVQEIKVVAQKRQPNGSVAARRVRKQGMLPGVVYDEKGQAQALQIPQHEFNMMLRKHTSESLLVDLQVGDEGVRKVLLREVQHDPVHGHVLHVDFVAISMTKKMRVAVRLQFVGEPAGVREQGGILEHLLRSVDIECLPSDLVESIPVDVSALKMGQTLLVRDMQVDPKLTIATAGDVAVATVAAPIAEEVVAVEAVEGAEAAEPEVITAKKEEGEEEEGAEAKPKEKPAKEKKEDRSK